MNIHVTVSFVVCLLRIFHILCILCFLLHLLCILYISCIKLGKADQNDLPMSLKQCLCAIFIKYVGISLKPCNSESSYNPTLRILQCNTDLTEIIGASLVFIAHCSKQL